jgi:CheY-like chemotaxis protein
MQEALHASEVRRSLAEERCDRLNHTFAVLSGVSQTIARERELQPLLERACRVAVEADPHSFDLVVTDHNMPEMTGVEFAGRVLAHRPDAVIVLASGRLSAEEIEKAHARGVREVIAKPGAVEHLPDIVARLTQPRGQLKTPK